MLPVERTPQPFAETRVRTRPEGVYRQGYLAVTNPSHAKKEAKPMDYEAARNHVKACRAQFRALRPYSPEWERANVALEAAEVELDQMERRRLAVNQNAAA